MSAQTCHSPPSAHDRDVGPIVLQGTIRNADPEISYLRLEAICRVTRMHCLFVDHRCAMMCDRPSTSACSAKSTTIVRRFVWRLHWRFLPALCVPASTSHHRCGKHGPSVPARSACRPARERYLRSMPRVIRCSRALAIATHVALSHGSSVSVAPTPLQPVASEHVLRAALDHWILSSCSPAALN